MNQNNSSSAYANEVVSIDDFNDKNHGGELQKLKCENFQLRLMCYNYENTLSELECNANDENEVCSLKKSYYQRIEMIKMHEENIQRLQKENFYLKKQLQEYTTLENSSVISFTNNKTQTDFECIKCEEKDLKNIKKTDELILQIKCLENVNLDLQSTIMESQVSKPETLEVGCLTENVYLPVPDDSVTHENDLLPDLDSDSTDIKISNSMNMKFIFDKTLLKLDKFLKFYYEDDIKMSNLEKELMSTLQLESNRESINDEKYKADLFQDGTQNWETNLVNEIMAKCQNKIIDDDIYELISSDGDDDAFENRYSLNKVSVDNPNVLIIQSVIDKLNLQSECKKLLKKKIKSNETWHKNATKTKLSTNIAISSVNCLNEEFDIHIEKISNILSSFTKLIPVLQLSFSKINDHIISMQSFMTIDNIKNDIDHFRTFVKQYHETNKKTFNDKCSLFIQAMTECILSLNKEKMLLNNTSELYKSVESYKFEQTENIEIVIVDENDRKIESMKRITKIPQKTNRPLIDSTSHKKTNLENVFKDNEIQIDVLDVDAQSYDMALNKGDRQNQIKTGIFDNHRRKVDIADEPKQHFLKNFDNQSRFADKRDVESQTNFSDLCVYVCNEVVFRHETTQTNFVEITNLNKSVVTDKLSNEMEIFINCFEADNTKTIRNETRKNENINEEIIVYSNQSNRTYNVIENTRFSLKTFSNKSVNEYLSKSAKYIHCNLRRCFSLDSKSLFDRLSLDHKKFYSYSNLNENNKIPDNLRQKINYLTRQSVHDESTSSEISLNRENMFHNHQKLNVLNVSSGSCKSRYPSGCDLKSSHNVSIEMDEMFYLFKIRMIKLIFIHDLKKYIQSITQKDSLITSELSRIVDTFTEFKSQHLLDHSELFFEIQNNIHEWRNQLEAFNNYIMKTSRIPAILLAVSDGRLIQMSLDGGEVELDFFLSNNDTYFTQTDVLEYLESLIKKINQQNHIMDQLYFNINEKKQKILFQFSDEYQKLYRDLKNKIHLKYVQLKEENEKLKSQYETISSEKEKILSQMENIKKLSKKYFKELTKEKETLMMDLEKIIQEKEKLNKKFDIKTEEDIRQKVIHETELNAKFDEINDLRKEQSFLLNENQNMGKTISDLRKNSEIQNEEKIKLNNVINESKSMMTSIVSQSEELRKEIEILRQHEKQLLLDNQQFETRVELKNLEMKNLQTNLESYQAKINEYENRITTSANDHLSKIDDLNLKINKLQTESLQIKENLFFSNKEKEKLTQDLEQEKVSFAHLNDRYQCSERQLERVHLDFESLSKNYSLKLKQFEINKQYVNEIQYNVLYLAEAIIEVLTVINSTKSRRSWELKFDALTKYNMIDTEDLKQLKNINDLVNLLINSMEKEIGKVRTHHLKNHSCKDALIQEENGDTPLYQICKISSPKDHLKLAIEKGINMEKNNNPDCKIGKRKNVETFSNTEEAEINYFQKPKNDKHERRKPIPTPREYSKQIKNTFKNYQRNKSNNQLNSNINTENAVESLNDSQDTSFGKESFLSLTVENNQKINEERSTFSVDEANLSQLSGPIILENEITNNHSDIIAEVGVEEGVRYKYLKSPDESQQLTESNDKDLRICQVDANNFQRCINLINTENGRCPLYVEKWNISNNKLSENNFYQLISSNQYLTESLVKVTNQMIDFQNKLEEVSAELYQCQTSKHEMSLELVSKYDKIKNLQTIINNFQNNSTMSNCLSKSSQTSSKKFYYFCKNFGGKEYNDNLCSPKRSQKIKDHEEVSPRQLRNALEILNSENNTDQLRSNASIKINMDEDWDDVTRTMIKCLTTLSEVQESLVTPPLLKETDVLMSPSNCPNEIDPSIENKKDQQDITNRQTIFVAFIKEKKYQIIRHIISTMSKDLSELQTLEEFNPIHAKRISIIEKIKKSHYKINYIINNGFKTYPLLIEQWLLIQDTQVPSNKNKSPIKLGTNEYLVSQLNISDKLNVDFVRLQQKLKRYQSRYKSLKHAIMTNKCVLKDSSKTVPETNSTSGI